MKTSSVFYELLFNWLPASADNHLFTDVQTLTTFLTFHVRVQKFGNDVYVLCSSVMGEGGALAELQVLM